MEKRVLLAVFLSFLVLFVYQSLFIPPETPPMAPDQAQVSTTTSQSVPPPESEAQRERNFSEILSNKSREVSETEYGTATPTIADSQIREIVVETPNVRAVFANRGAKLTSWLLKNYFNDEGKPLELVSADLPDDLARPFSLVLEDAELTRRLDEALFVSSHDGLELIDEPGLLSFEYEDSEGLRVRKDFHFDPAGLPYVVTFTADVKNGGQSLNPTLRWDTGVGGASDTSGSTPYSEVPQGIFYSDGEVSRLDLGDVEEKDTYEENFRFVGVDDHYFIAVALPEESTEVVFLPRDLTSTLGGTEEEPIPVIGHTLTFAKSPVGIRHFFGPKEFGVLGLVDQELVRAIDFGWFSFLVVPLLRALKWIYGYVGNYGWSIIILTILLNAVMFPLRHKSVVSMRKMQEIQPEVKAIQNRYSKLKATDPARQKMNSELMALYRERGVNPASGCMPMLLTMPVLFAFYSLLAVAIEIRGAPFVLWITNLAQHDPMYVTPILMGMTMVIQQRMTPSTADPMQQKIMMFMPVMFTFMFLWAPSGLVLYWLTSNIWAVGQQYVTNKIIGPTQTRTVRPPAERRLKRVGSGQTAKTKK